MGRLVQLFSPFSKMPPKFLPCVNYCSIILFGDNVDSFCTQNKYLAQYGPQGSCHGSGKGRHGSIPVPCSLDHRTEDKSVLEASVTAASEELGFYTEFKRPCVLLKTTGASSRGSIKVHRKHEEVFKIHER